MRKALILAGALAAIATSTLAAEVTERTPCSVAIKAWDGKDIEGKAFIGLDARSSSR
jgi:hypothetical protein